MIDVTHHWIVAVVWAAGCGAVGGLVYELVQSRHGDSGMIELPSRQQVHSPGIRVFQDWGVWASVIVGAVAAAAFLYFLAPTDTTITQNGATTITRAYDPYKLIPASLIVGSAGASFISAMQQKLLALVNATQLQTLAGAVRQAAAAPAPGVTAEGVLPTQSQLDRIEGRLDALRDLADTFAPAPPPRP